MILLMMKGMLKYMNRTMTVAAIAAIVLLACAVSCVREDTGDCPVPHHFEYDWCNRIEAESCQGQNHLRLYDGSGVCDPHDCPQEGTVLYLKQRHYRVLTYNDRLQGIVYGDLHDAELARATVTEVPTPELVERVEALAAGEAPVADALIGQAESFLYRDSIPAVRVDFRYEGRSLLVPEPVGYEIVFRSKIKDRTMADSKSMELTLSGVVPEVRLVCGSRTDVPVRTALARTTREEERYRSYLYVFGLDRQRVLLKAYVESARFDTPVYIERDLTDIMNKALDEAGQTGDPRIEFDLELELGPQQAGVLIVGSVRVVGWDEVEGGDMGV